MRPARKPDRNSLAAAAMAVIAGGLVLGAIGGKAVNPVMKEAPGSIWERGFSALTEDLSPYEQARRDWLASGPGGTRQAFAPEFADEDWAGLDAAGDNWLDSPPVWEEGPAFRSYKEDLSSPLPEWDDAPRSTFRSEAPREEEVRPPAATERTTAEPLTADGELPAIW